MNCEPNVIRDLHKQENEMMNHRMSWFLTLQGFLFAALAFGWDKDFGLIIVFSGVGILSSLSVGILLRHAALAMRKLQRMSGTPEEQPVAGRRYDENSPIIHFLFPWHFLPVMFGLAWLAILLIRQCGVAQR